MEFSSTQIGIALSISGAIMSAFALTTAPRLVRVAGPIRSFKYVRATVETAPGRRRRR